MQLSKGKIAPDFTVKDIFGNDFKLSNLRGKRIYLAFHRNVGCPFCNVRLHKMMGNSVKLRNAGLEVVFFFESTTDKVRSSIFHQGLMPWTMISDNELKIYKQYGLEKSMLKLLGAVLNGSLMKEQKEAKSIGVTATDKDASVSLMPADFFINEDFELELAYYGKDPGDHVLIEEVKKFAGVS